MDLLRDLKPSRQALHDLGPVESEFGDVDRRHRFAIDTASVRRRNLQLQRRPGPSPIQQLDAQAVKRRARHLLDLLSLKRELRVVAIESRIEIVLEHLGIAEEDQVDVFRGRVASVPKRSSMAIPPLRRTQLRLAA